MKPIRKCDKKLLITVEDYLSGVISNCYTDYDGYGYYATESEYSEEIALPSDTFKNGIKSGFSHVMWYNK